MIKGTIQRPTIKSIRKQNTIKAVIVSQSQAYAQGIIKRPVIKAIKRQEVIKAVLNRGTGIPGPQGPQGERGPEGPPGEGGTSDKYYTQSFTNLSTVVVTHNLGKYPSIVIFDSANDEVEGHVEHNSVNQLTVTFSSSFSGRVVCN